MLGGNMVMFRVRRQNRETIVLLCSTCSPLLFMIFLMGMCGAEADLQMRRLRSQHRLRTYDNSHALFDQPLSTRDPRHELFLTLPRRHSGSCNVTCF
jgi:hypothetical protein